MNKKGKLAKRLVRIAGELVDGASSMAAALKADLTGVPVTAEDFNRLPDVLYTSFPAAYLDSIREHGVGAEVKENANVGKGFFVAVDANNSREYANAHGGKLATYAVDKSALSGHLFYDGNDYYTLTYLAALSGEDIEDEDYDFDLIDGLMEEHEDDPDEVKEAVWDEYFDNLCFYVDCTVPFASLEEC